MDTSPKRLSPAVATLLRAARRLQTQGEVAKARIVLRALAEQFPDEPAVWLTLATAAETRAEQRQALERTLALDPTNPLALRGIARFGVQPQTSAAQPPPVQPQYVASQPTPQRTSADLPPAVVLTTEQAEPLPAREAAPRPPYLVYAAVAALLIAILLLLLLRPGAGGETAAPTATPPLPGAGIVTPLATINPSPSPSAIGATVLIPAATSNAEQPTSSPAPALPTSQAAVVPLPTLAGTTSPTSVPAATPVAAGTVIEAGIWRVSLLRPEYGVALDGAIGALQPQGQFILALVAIGQNGTGDTTIPGNLLLLRDERGNRYQPVPGASTIYLDNYQRGLRGDLSFEEPIPEGALVSVPLIFDVPPTARGLRLVVNGMDNGWPVAR